MLRFFSMLSFTLLMLNGAITHAQESDKPLRLQLLEEANYKIISLKDGVLLVKLTSDRRKIATLEAQVAASPNDKRLAKKLKEAVEYRESFNQEWVSSLKDVYTFSELMFFYDYDAKQIADGVTSGIFMDETLRVIPDLSIEDSFFLVLGEGTTEESGLDAYLIHDQNLRPLAKPFPYYFRKNDFFKVVFSIFNSKASRHRSTEKVARDIQDSFTKFYEKATA